MKEVRVKIKVKDGGRIPLPVTPYSAGVDLRAYIENSITLQPGERALVSAGIYLEIPPGFFGIIAPRSGLAINEGLTVLNAPGIIDSDYRGEVKVILINHSKNPVVINRGDRIAQLIILPHVKVIFEEVNELSVTERGQGGFGSSGRN